MVEKIGITQIKDYLKSLIECDKWYTGKIDENQEEAIALYANRRQIAPISQFKHLQSYTIIPMTLLLKWTKNYASAEKKANEIYKELEHCSCTIEGMHCFIECLYEGPVDLGTDENGVFKFSIEFNLYIRKGEK